MEEIRRKRKSLIQDRFVREHGNEMKEGRRNLKGKNKLINYLL